MRKSGPESEATAKSVATQVVKATQASRIHQDMTIMIDVSDLIYYIGHHPNLTGIQRVQANFIVAARSIAGESVNFICWNAKRGGFDLVDAKLLISVVHDLNHAEDNRSVNFNQFAAREGIFPGSKPIGEVAGEFQNMVIVLLGAAWVIPDYFAKIAALKRKYSASFMMTVHDLIPIYAAHTCDQGTALAFRSFLLASSYVVDEYVCVSENTHRDLRRIFKHWNLAEPLSTVITSGFEPVDAEQAARIVKEPSLRSEEPFVLFVSTIEGRKNHILAYKTWERLLQHYETPPRLVCVGRYGWRADEFLQLNIVTDGLGGKIEILSDISDGELEWLYRNCLFTIYPSLYEGWGLPISESLARGKLCITSNTSSMPEAGGDMAIYIDPDSPDDLYDAICKLLDDPASVASREAEIRARFQPRSWVDVAQDYVEATGALSRSEVRNTHIELAPGREYVFRSPPSSFDMVGEGLQRSLQNAFRGPATGHPLSLAQFCEAHYLRGGGAWSSPEPWGTWLGIPGGSLEFWWSGASTELIFGFLAEAFPQFEGRTARLSMNRRTVAVCAKPRQDLYVCELPVWTGLNRLTIEMELSAADQNLSFGVDSRGPMLGFISMVALERTDALGRVALLERQILTFAR